MSILYLSTGIDIPIVLGMAYGTIVLMADHRIRLSDEDVAVIVAALRARLAMTAKLRRHRLERLIERLAEGKPGNPRWLIDEETQTHEEELDPDDLD